MNFKLKLWKQQGSHEKGKMVSVDAKDISPDASFLEMLDVVNERFIEEGKDPIAFDHDCREGICGACGSVVNGYPHGHEKETTLCQLHMRSFKDGSVIVVEPWRATAFPVLKDLMVDRSSLDEIIKAGGYITAKTGSAPDGNAVAIPPDEAETAMDAAVCIGCGACVAACPNASAMLFTGAKVSHLSRLPQGRVERKSRVLNMLGAMEEAGFGSCSSHGECEAYCPKGITMDHIALSNREYLLAQVKKEK